MSAPLRLLVIALCVSVIGCGEEVDSGDNEATGRPEATLTASTQALTLQVVSATGTAARWAWVEVWKGKPWAEGSHQVYAGSNEQSRYAFSLPQARYTARAFGANGRALPEFNVELSGEQSLTWVDAAGTFSLRTEVVNADGSALAWAWVEVYDTAGTKVDEGNSADGIRTRALAAGHYRVKAWSGAALLGQAEQLLVADGTLRLQAAAVPPPLPPKPTPGQGCQPSLQGFVTREQAQLFLDGQLFRASGKNLYFLQMEYSFAQHSDGDPAPRIARLRKVLEETACTPFNVIRTWGFNALVGHPGTIQEGPFRYREEGLRSLDQAIADAKAQGLRVILTLANNWEDLGGLDRYAQWAHLAHDDFFSDAQMQSWYKDYASMLARRINTFTGVAYRDEPAILAVEVANELRCVSCRGTQRLQDTVAELARHLKQVFPRHLISDGGEGFDDDATLYPGLTNLYAVRGDEGASYSKLASIPELDLLSHHFYPLSWGLNTGSDTQLWIDKHQTIAAAAGKVGYLGEHGLDLADAQRAPLFDAWLQRFFGHNSGLLGVYWPLHLSGNQGPSGPDTYYREDPLTQEVLSSWGQAL